MTEDTPTSGMRLTCYQLFQPPIDLSVEDWTMREAKAYFTWFKDHIQERIQVLQRVLDCADVDCPLDRSPDSLFCLGAFFVGQVRRRPKTEEELNQDHQFIESLSGPLQTIVTQPDWVLDSTTLSLCLDVGTYVGEVLRTSHPQLEWVIWTKRTWPNKRPALVGFKGGIPLYPSDISSTIALRAARGEVEPQGLREAFDWWSLRVASPDDQGSTR